MTNMAMMSSGLLRPILSEITPKSGEDMIESSMGAVLMMPESVGSNPCICRIVGTNARIASMQML